MKRIVGTLILVSFILVTAHAIAAKAQPAVKYPGKTMGQVTFEHKHHLAHKLKCADCHPKIFPKMKALGNKVTMAAINKGKFCGVCHVAKGKAFPVAGNCARCHKKAK